MKKIIILCGAALTVAACDETATTDATAATPTPAEQACLRDVTEVTNNPEIVLLGSEFSEAGTFVRVGVGPDRAEWKCIAYSDGTTDGIEFTGSEGAA